jgi:phage terminase large subunit-like protein
VDCGDSGDRVRGGAPFPQLEEQMLNMASAGYVGAKSPDRLDALVWALSELMLGPQHSFASGPLRL